MPSQDAIISERFHPQRYRPDSCENILLREPLRLGNSNGCMHAVALNQIGVVPP
jgi:hypothetical protein